MGLEAHTQEQCMYFVGGPQFGDTGRTYAGGGCTKAWWDSQPDIDTVAGKADAMAKLMGADGEVILADPFIVNDFDDVSGTWIELIETSSGDFDDIEAGMLLYAWNSGGQALEAVGIYIVDSRTATTITIIAQAHENISTEDEVGITVGGAFINLNLPLDNYTDAALFSQEVHINKHLTPAAAMETVDWGGAIAENSRLLIQGFNTSPGDMNIGGAYHQSTWNFKKNGVDVTKNIVIDCVTSDTGFLWDDSVNITFRNLYAKNVGVGASGGFFLSTVASGDAFGCDFINCKATEGNNSFGGPLGFADNCHVKGCYAGNSYTGIRLSGDNNSVEGCVVEPVAASPSGGIFMHDHEEWPGGNTIRGNLVIGGVSGIWTTGHNIIENNTCIGQTVGCIVYNDGLGIPTIDLSNNILMPDYHEGGKAITGHEGDSTYKVNLRGQNNVLWHSNTSGDVPTAIEDLINLGQSANDSDISTWLFEDPEMDGDYAPANKNLRLTDQFGDWRWLGGRQVKPDLPDAINVYNTDTVDDEAGTLTLPAAADVEDGINYGAGGDGSTGTLTLPTEPQVAAGVQYGGDGTEYTGTFDAAPDAPVITGVVDDGNGDSVTVSVTGTDTIQLYYRQRYADSWTEGQTRAGSGDITQDGLAAGTWYEIYATADNGGESPPSNLITVYLASTAGAGTLKTAIYAILSGDATVNGLCDGRITPGGDPARGVACVTYHKVSGINTHTHDGPDDLATSTIQVNSYDTSDLGAETLAAAAEAALNGFSGTVNGVAISYIALENDGDLDDYEAQNSKLSRHGKRQDYIVTYTKL